MAKEPSSAEQSAMPVDRFARVIRMTGARYCKVTPRNNKAERPMTLMAQATVSQHLAVLKKVRLIQGTVKGTSVCYCLNPSQIPKLVTPLREVLDAIEKGPDLCCAPGVPNRR
jgi:DNA-binding transcriptional ArsR family regulator